MLQQDHPYCVLLLQNLSTLLVELNVPSIPFHLFDGALGCGGNGCFFCFVEMIASGEFLETLWGNRDE